MQNALRLWSKSKFGSPEGASFPRRERQASSSRREARAEASTTGTLTHLVTCNRGTGTRQSARSDRSAVPLWSALSVRALSALLEHVHVPLYVSMSVMCEHRFTPLQTSVFRDTAVNRYYLILFKQLKPCMRSPVLYQKFSDRHSSERRGKRKEVLSQVNQITRAGRRTYHTMTDY